MNRSVILSVIALTACMAVAAQGALVVYEPFQGYTPGSMKDQAPNANTIGLNPAQVYHTTSSSTTFVAQEAGLSFGDLVTNGGSLLVTATGNPNTIGTQLAVPAVTGDLFQSYLVNISQYSSSTSAPAGIGMNIANALNGAGSNGRFQALADISTANTQRVSAVYGGGAGSPATTGLEEGKTYLILAKFSNVGTTLSTTNRGYAYLWALDLDQFNTFKVDGITEDELNAATIGTDSASVTARYVSSAVTSGTYTFDSTKFLTLVGWGSTGATTRQIATLDEIRYGTTLADVTPVVPEPATLTLLVLSGLAVVRRRTR